MANRSCPGILSVLAGSSALLYFLSQSCHTHYLQLVELDHDGISYLRKLWADRTHFCIFYRKLQLVITIEFT